MHFRRISVFTCALTVLTCATAIAGEQVGPVAVPPRFDDPPLELIPGLPAGAHCEWAEPIDIPPMGLGLPDGAENPEGRHIPRFVEPPREIEVLGAPAPVEQDSSAFGEPLTPATIHSFIGLNKSDTSEYDPPDCDVAVGHHHVVEVVNDDFRVYDKCGTQVLTFDINTYLGDSRFIFDPKVIYDPWHNRFVMLWIEQDSSPQESETIFIISKDSTGFQNGAWVYKVGAIKDAGTGNASWADYCDLGYSPNGVHCSGNWFRFAGGYRYGVTRSFRKAEMYSGMATPFVDFVNLTNADGTVITPRSARMQSTSGTSVEMYFVGDRGAGGTEVSLFKLTDPWGAPSMSRTNLTVGAYASPPAVAQPSGSTISVLDTRLLFCTLGLNQVLGGNPTLYTGLSVAAGPSNGIRRIILDPATNTIEFDVSLVGTGTQDYFMPAPAVDYSGRSQWVFGRVSDTEFMSVRYNDVTEGPAGTHTTEGSLQLKGGDANYTGFARWGDYFGAVMDWGDYWFGTPGALAARLWMVGEYARTGGTWGTWIGFATDSARGVLNVSPAGAQAIVGPQGGPFVPASVVYSLTNSGSVGLTWRLTGVPSWLTASATTGDLYTNDSVTVSTNATTNGLAPGAYAANLVFTDCYTGGAVLTRVINLTVQTKANLSVSPATSFTSSGPQGGPFVPASKVYTLTNTGQQAMNWTASDNVAWATTSPANGALGGGASTNVTVSLNAAANALVPGVYNGTASFTNATNGLGNTSRALQLTVTSACVPCDTNCDGSVNGFDVDSFTGLLTGSGTPCSSCAGDVNGDGSVNGFDVDGFVAALTGGSC
ncbi:MAG: hypothetical protein CHACPFDD_01968 [Phycisphaerae bacterium]|nr:hypothetical protein [Phycisphaerae bacterium]